MKLTWLMVLVVILTSSCSNSEEGFTDSEIQLQISQDLDFYLLLRLTNEVGNLKKSISDEKKIKESGPYKEALNLISLLEKRYINFENNGLKVIQSDKLKEELLSIEYNVNSKTEIDDYCGCQSIQGETRVLSCSTGCNFSYIYCMENNLGSCDSMRRSCNSQCCESICSEPE